VAVFTPLPDPSVSRVLKQINIAFGHSEFPPESYILAYFYSH